MLFALALWPREKLAISSLSDSLYLIDWTRRGRWKLDIIHPDEEEAVSPVSDANVS